MYLLSLLRSVLEASKSFLVIEEYTKIKIRNETALSILDLLNYMIDQNVIQNN